MFFSDLTPISQNDPFYPKFFDDTPIEKIEKEEDYYKIYNDGNHYIAVPCISGNKRKETSQIYNRDCTKNMIFHSLYTQAVRQGLVNNELTDFIKNGLLKQYPKDDNIDNYIKYGIENAMLKTIEKSVISSSDKQYIYAFFDYFYFEGTKQGLRKTELANYLKEEFVKHFESYKPAYMNDCPIFSLFIKNQIKRVVSNIYKRKKRYYRKYNLNRWNYFMTITYKDSKHTEDDFRRKLKKTLSNLHTRRGWKYMGVFERAPETGRLHFHAIVYVPFNEMIGKLYEESDYNVSKGMRETRTTNTFFETNYGRSDFKAVHQNSAHYLLKYISKTGEKLVISRHIPTEVYKKINRKDIAAPMLNFIQKYVLYDDTIDWLTDINNYDPTQVSMWSLMCNPSS